MKNSNILHIRSKKLINSLFMGNFKAAFHGRGVEFRDFREYEFGDDSKYIDWVRSSTEGTTVMRRYKEEKEGTIYMIIDTNTALRYSDGFQKKDIFKNLVSLIGEATIASGENLGSIILGNKKNTFIAPNKKQENILKILQNIENNLDFREREETLDIRFLLRKNIKPGVIFILSDSRNIDENSFKSVSSKHDIIYLHISSNTETSLGNTGIKTFFGKKTSSYIDLGNASLKEKYNVLRAKKLMEFSQTLSRLGVDSAFLHPESNIIVELSKLLRQRNTYL